MWAKHQALHGYATLDEFLKAQRRLSISLATAGEPMLAFRVSGHRAMSLPNRGTKE